MHYAPNSIFSLLSDSKTNKPTAILLKWITTNECVRYFTVQFTLFFCSHFIICAVCLIQMLWAHPVILIWCRSQRIILLCFTISRISQLYYVSKSIWYNTCFFDNFYNVQYIRLRHPQFNLYLMLNIFFFERKHTIRKLCKILHKSSLRICWWWLFAANNVWSRCFIGGSNRNFTYIWLAILWKKHPSFIYNDIRIQQYRLVFLKYILCSRRESARWKIQKVSEKILEWILANKFAEPTCWCCFTFNSSLNEFVQT